MSGFMPSVDDVRHVYMFGALPEQADSRRIVAEMGREFDRWLAEHDRQVLETVLGPLRHILSSGYGCADCAYEDLREVARMEGLAVHSEHI